MKQKSPRKLSKALVKAIKNKDFDGVKAAVEEGANPDVIPKDILESFNDFMGFSTKSPLKLAIDKGTPEIVSYLIDKSKLSEIDYLFFYARNQKQGLDMNPLMYAVYKNKPDFVDNCKAQENNFPSIWWRRKTSIYYGFCERTRVWKYPGNTKRSKAAFYIAQ